MKPFRIGGYLSVHQKRQHDLEVDPLLCVNLHTENRSQRIFCFWWLGVQVFDLVYDCRAWRRLAQVFGEAAFRDRKADFAYAVAVDVAELYSLQRKMSKVVYPSFVSEGKPGYDEYLAAHHATLAAMEPVHRRQEELQTKLADYWDRVGV
jgi:hypothetical protein